MSILNIISPLYRSYLTSFHLNNLGFNNTGAYNSVVILSLGFRVLGRNRGLSGNTSFDSAAAGNTQQ
jgi:hypothetical protein